MSEGDWNDPGYFWEEDLQELEEAIDKQAPLDKSYDQLSDILDRAFEQCTSGKGRDRHGTDRPFSEQWALSGGKYFGYKAHLYQAGKKITEAPTINRLRGKEAAAQEILGAIVYAALAVISLENDWE